MNLTMQGSEWKNKNSELDSEPDPKPMERNQNWWNMRASGRFWQQPSSCILDHL